MGIGKVLDARGAFERPKGRIMVASTQTDESQQKKKKSDFLICSQVVLFELLGVYFFYNLRIDRYDNGFLIESIVADSTIRIDRMRIYVPPSRVRNGHPSNKLPISLFPKTSSKTSLHQTHQISSLQQPNQPPLKRKRTQCATASSPPEAAEVEEPPSIGFAFVGSRLLPDGTPDIAMRSACGGQKLRDIMLDSHIDLYGPYAKPLSNCAGGGTCGTCLVEVVEGKELLSPRTDIEKEQLKRKPKTWRLACQTTVGNKDSRGE
ncbi:uncharacterized protein A4U43_C10F7590, partial [Asparagus officinalis]